MCIYIERERFILRSWLIRLGRLAKPKSAGWASRLETHKELMVQFKSKGHLLGQFPLAQEKPVFCSTQALTDRMRPTYIRESDLLYSKSTDLNVNLIPKHPYRNVQNNV